MIENTEEGAWNIAAEVANIISCDVPQGADGKLASGPVMSTRMMPPPELQLLENETTSTLDGLTSLRREGETLVLKGEGKKEIFTPAAGPGPATKDSVNWMCWKSFLYTKRRPLPKSISCDLIVTKLFKIFVSRLWITQYLP